MSAGVVSADPGPMSGRPSECQLGSAGCRTGIHPGRSAMLVTDGSFSGTKDARARELGTRRVTPEQYAVLLRHVQPAVEKAMQVARRLYAASPPGLSPRGGS